MNIVKFRVPGQPAEVGLLTGDEITPLDGVADLGQLWALSLDQLRERLAEPVGSAPVPLAEARLLAPVDGRTEVWGAGVTYEISREARIEESEQAADAYALVYDAQRPEVFFKSVAWRVSGPDRPIGIREDSTVNVPEPELALVLNRFGEIVGYTICDDVSSRSIEGENPLYLPQAKIYSGACALGPYVVPAWEVADPYQLGITLAIDRTGARYWEGVANTGQLHRKLDELAAYLMRGDVHPQGVVLSTGTCLVPPPPFTLAEGDTVAITIDGLGTLRNPVLRGLIPEEQS